MEDKCYIVGFNDFLLNDIQFCSPVFPTVSQAITNANSKIIEVLATKFDIYPQIKHMYTEENIENTSESVIQITNNKSLKILKTEKIIDIYSVEIIKGYIYNKHVVRHVLKFFINEQRTFNPKPVKSSCDLFIQAAIMTHPFQPTIKKIPQDILSELKEKVKKFKID